MDVYKKKRIMRIKRHGRVRAKIKGTAEVPRLCVFRSSRHIYAQAIDDEKRVTIVSADDLRLKDKNKTEKAFLVGENLGGALKGKGVKKAVFDRGGFKYHGRVKAIADGLRKAGLKF